MADYRLYCIDSNGQIGLADWIEADSDEMAVLIALSAHPDASKCEIWHKSRLVGTLSPKGRFDPGRAWSSESHSNFLSPLLD